MQDVEAEETYRDRVPWPGVLRGKTTDKQCCAYLASEEKSRHSCRYEQEIRIFICIWHQKKIPSLIFRRHRETTVCQKSNLFNGGNFQIFHLKVMKLKLVQNTRWT